MRVALVALLALAAPGHVEPQVSEAPAGSRATFSFLVEHGCDGSPTIGVAIQLPEGAFDPVPVAPAGWTGTVEATAPPVVTFTGGPLPADAPGAFGVEMVTPNRPGEEVLFPTVQTCEAGEIGWIDPAEGAEEPAPRIRLTENPNPILPTSTTTAAEETTTSEVPASSDPATSVPEEVEVDDDGSSAPLWLLGGLAALAGAGVAWAAARRARAG